MSREIVRNGGFRPACAWHLAGAAWLALLVGCATTADTSQLQPGESARAQATKRKAPRHDSASGSILGEYDAALNQPEIILNNRSEWLVSVSLAGPETHSIHVAPQSRRKVVLKPGRYQYVAKAKGVEAESGAHDFEPQYRYTWTFEISAVVE